MALDLKRLVQEPSETLNVEYKDWIDPSTSAGMGKIVKACLAFWNSGGGHLVIGVKHDPSLGKLRANPGGALATAGSLFDSDQIPQLVNDYAHTKLEIKVEFAEIDGTQFPVISVPNGVRHPNVARKPIKEDGKTILKEDVVYVRSVEANGTVSTAEARRGDWEYIIRVCLNNHEADIGLFLQRHLTPGHIRNIGEFLSAGTKDVPSSDPESVTLLNNGRDRFETIQKGHGIDLSPYGFFEVAIVVPISETGQPNKKFLRHLMTSKKSHSGWPLWLDSGQFGDTQSHPRVNEKRWEAWVDLLNKEVTYGLPTLDFWIADPAGGFYHRRALWEDGSSRRQGASGPKNILNPGMQVEQVMDAFLTAQAFARAMGTTDPGTLLDFRFRWSGLRGRTLGSTQGFAVLLWNCGPANDDIVTTHCGLPLDAAPSSLYQYAWEATAPLFRAFDGFEFEVTIIKGIVDAFLAQPTH